MAKLSVNVNKIATLRNARGKNMPHLCHVVEDLIQFGVKSITVHPRPDGRHILYQDVYDLSQLLEDHPSVELNVEGLPDDSFLQLMEKVCPSQCTLVPDAPNVLTSNAGWKLKKNQTFLKEHLLFLKKLCIRSALFIDPFLLEEDNTECFTLEKLKPDRIELYTEAYANAWSGAQKETVTATYTRIAKKINTMGIEINAGHDLNLKNLSFFLKKVPNVKEVSIGHALICESLYLGLHQVVSEYLEICQS